MQKPDNEISQRHRERRDKNWDLISEIVEQDGVKPYLSSGKMISEIALSKEKSRKDIYKYRRRYLQSGKIKNSLLPLFNKCGAPGKKRLGTATNQTKLGKPSNRAQKEGRKIGIRIIPDIEKKFRRGFIHFYDKKK